MELSQSALRNSSPDQLTAQVRERSAALADARRQSSAAAIDRAAVSEARSTEQVAETREAISRALGANTRLSIARDPGSPRFVYRAIDVDTGEIVHEWPQERFIDLVRGVREDVRTDVEAGLLLDRTA